MMDRRIVSPWFLDRKSEPAYLMSEPGDVIIDEKPGPGDQTASLAPIHSAIADAVRSAVADGERPAAILGDCCQVIGVMAGLARAGIRPALVWLDSHGDFNTWETTPSGFLGGMPLAMLTGRGDQRMMAAMGLDPLADNQVWLSDARDLDPGERLLVEASQVHHHTTLDDLLDNLPGGPLYVHFDSDIIDSVAAPAFLYPVKGGPTPAEAREALAKLQATKRVAAFSMTVGWDVTTDRDKTTEKAVRLAFRGLTAS
jgi:arginase